MQRKHRVLELLVLAAILVGMAAVVAGQDKDKAAEKRETLTLTIDWRDEHYPPIATDANAAGRVGGNVRLEIKDVMRDVDGCIIGFTVPWQTVKVKLPQGRFGMSLHRNWEPTPQAGVERAMKELQEQMEFAGALSLFDTELVGVFWDLHTYDALPWIRAAGARGKKVRSPGP